MHEKPRRRAKPKVTNGSPTAATNLAGRQNGADLAAAAAPRSRAKSAINLAARENGRTPSPGGGAEGDGAQPRESRLSLSLCLRPAVYNRGPVGPALPGTGSARLLLLLPPVRLLGRPLFRLCPAREQCRPRRPADFCPVQRVSALPRRSWRGTVSRVLRVSREADSPTRLSFGDERAARDRAVLRYSHRDRDCSRTMRGLREQPELPGTIDLVLKLIGITL